MPEYWNYRYVKYDTFFHPLLSTLKHDCWSLSKGSDISCVPLRRWSPRPAAGAPGLHGGGRSGAAGWPCWLVAHFCAEVELSAGPGADTAELVYHFPELSKRALPHSEQATVAHSSTSTESKNQTDTVVQIPAFVLIQLVLK